MQRERRQAGGGWFALVLCSVGGWFFFFVVPACAQSLALNDSPSDVQNVEFVGQTGGACRAVAVSDDRVVISQGARVTSVDLSNPDRPVAIASLLLPRLVQDLQVSGDHVLALAGDLHILNTGSTGTLTATGRVASAGTRLAVDGDIAFVIESGPRIRTVDVGLPSRPRILATLQFPGPAAEIIRSSDIALRGDLGFVSYERQRTAGFPPVGGFFILDLSDPKTPVVIVDFQLGSPADSLALDGDFLHVHIRDRVVSVNVQDPRNPGPPAFSNGPATVRQMLAHNGFVHLLAGDGTIWTFRSIDDEELALEGVFEPAGNPVRIGAAGDRLLVASDWGGLRVLDALNAPEFDEIGSLTPAAEAWAIVIEGETAYLADGHNGLRILDVADPSQPREIAHIPTLSFARALALQAQRLYVAYEAGGVHEFDVSDPAQPRFTQSVATPGPATDVAVSGEFILVTAASGGLLLYDRDNLAAGPYSQFDEPSNAESLLTFGGLAYVGDRARRRVWVVDIRNPAAPSSLGLLTSEAPPVDLSFDGRYLAVAELDRGFTLFDLREGAAPLSANRFRRTGPLQSVLLAGNLAYLADERFGLRIVSMVRPFQLAEAGFFQAAGLPRAVTSSDGTIYLAAGPAGLYTLRYTWSPDLAIEGFNFAPQDIRPGDELFLEGTITNPSTVPLEIPAWVDILASGTPDFRPPYVRIAPRIRIAPGMTSADTIDLSQQRSLLLNLEEGVYYVGVVVDRGNAVAEFREDNNRLWQSTRPLYVGPRPASARSWMLYR